MKALDRNTKTKFQSLLRIDSTIVASVKQMGTTLKELKTLLVYKLELADDLKDWIIQHVENHTLRNHRD